MRLARMGLMLLIGTLVLGAALISGQSVLAQDEAACSYINPDGSVSGQLFLTLEDCAKAVLNETQRLGLTEGYGLYDKYALRVNVNGDVYAASTENMRSASDLEWQYLGNVLGAAPAQPTPRPQTQVQPQPQTGGQTTSSGEVQGVVPTSLQQIFDIAAEDINDFWSEIFKQYGYEYSQPRVFLHNRAQVSTGCGAAPAQVGPFYCNVDHAMYFPQAFMDDQWRRIGDYAVVTIIAHEWGHAVQSMLGGLNTGDYTITIELEADCFAGAYTTYANGQSTKIRLDASDIEEGATALFYAGDPDGTPWWDSQAHGTGDQRYQAFENGFKNGVSAC